MALAISQVVTHYRMSQSPCRRYACWPYRAGSLSTPKVFIEFTFHARADSERYLSSLGRAVLPDPESQSSALAWSTANCPSLALYVTTVPACPQASGVQG